LVPALILDIGIRKKFGKIGISKSMIWDRIISGDQKRICLTANLSILVILSLFACNLHHNLEGM
jgi:hypothetical protein